MLSDNGFAPRRQFVDDADVEVAVERHCQGAGDGRCCHHKDVWRVTTLRPQLGALGHAEAVLFVDDDESQTGKLHGVLDDGMCADEDVGGAVEQCVEYLLTAFPLHHTCQQGYADRHVAEKLHDGLQMLFGQDFRRCHDAGLVTVVDGDEHRHQCHEGLAAADVALQQTVHLPAAAHVLAYLADDALLGFGQLEGQVFVIERVKRIADLAEDVAAVFAALVAGIP